MTESPTNVSKSQSSSPSYSNTDFDSEDLNNNTNFNSINNNNSHSPADSQGDYNDSFSHLHAQFGAANNINNRKKASRACFHCQKAHLTCNDSRPCQRCIKRDLASTCADGIRKKAKYLQESYDVLPRSTSTINPGIPKTPSNHISLSSVATPPPTNFMNADISNPTYLDASAIFGLPLTDYGFGSETANLEYGFLSTMLQSPTLANATLSTNNNSATGTSSGDASPQLQEMTLYDPPWNGTETKQNGSGNLVALKIEPTTSSGFSVSPVTSAATASGPPQAQAQAQQLLQSQTPTAAPTALVGGTKRDSQGKRKSGMLTPEGVYANVKRPFNYAEGFHYLFKYVQDKMGKDDLMRISRALALFRPSFIALIMNLTEEDLIFMEKCFQRQLLEYEKLISFSGTPTVVWRRTGEIVLVGKEFSLLTQWGKDTLLGLSSGGRKMYIYELMDSQSTVEYWEKFAAHAFDNVESSVMTTCILVSPHNRPVPCTFCFTIKRDIFDLPSVIVGNFLPILS